MPTKLPLPPNTWFLGPTRVHTPNSLLITILAQLTVVSDRHTHTSKTHKPWNIGNNRPHLCTQSTLCGLIIISKSLVSNTGNEDKSVIYWQKHSSNLENAKQFTLRVYTQLCYIHTHLFNGPFPRLPRWAGTRKVKPIGILLKQETVSGSVISWAVCKSAPHSRQKTMLAPPT